MKKLTILLLAYSYCFAGSFMRDGSEFLSIDSKNNTVECTVQELCDISLIQDDIFQKWIMPNGDVWADSAKAKTVYPDEKGIQHVVIQSVAPISNNKVILVGLLHQYKFNLKSVIKSKTNNYVFLASKDKSFNTSNAIIDDGLKLDFTSKKLDYTYYTKGDTSSDITPIKIFNDGAKTYFQLSDTINTVDLPVVYTFNNDGVLEQLNNSRYRKPYFIVDGVLKQYAIVSGSVDNDDQVRVDIYHGKKPTFWGWLFQQYDRN